MHKGDRKNLRDQGWAENLRYLRNLRGGERLTQIPITSVFPKFLDIRCASAIANSHWVEIQQAK